MILFDSRIPADMLALSALRKEIGARLSAFALGENVRNAILLTVAEMGANAIRHSDPAPLEIGVRLRLAGPVLELEIEDDGGAFDCLAWTTGIRLSAKPTCMPKAGAACRCCAGRWTTCAICPARPTSSAGGR